MGSVADCSCGPAGAVEMSKAALHFANAATKVTMQPVVNEVLNERARIRQLQTEINSLRQQLVGLSFWLQGKKDSTLTPGLQMLEQGNPFVKSGLARSLPK